MTMEIGVLFADLRGFTSESELQSPLEVSAKLRRFYAHAEKVLFPEALIDKLIGDEVMALYVPPFMVPASDEVDDRVRRHIAHVMLKHTRSYSSAPATAHLANRTSRSVSGSISARRSSATSATPPCTTSRPLGTLSTRRRVSRPTRPVARFCFPHGWLAYSLDLLACPSWSCSRESKSLSTYAACSGSRGRCERRWNAQHCRSRAASFCAGDPTGERHPHRAL
jgi:hypothetical protein